MKYRISAAMGRFMIGACVLLWSVNLYSQSTAWNRIHPLPQGHDIVDIQKIPGTGRLIAACNNTTILISDNAGETWQTINYPGNQPYFFNPVGFFFINDHVGFLYGTYKNILKTTDAGLTWNLQYQYNDNFSKSVCDMDFMTDSVGFAITEDLQLMKTTNQGQTWQRIYTGYPFTSSKFISIEFLGNKGYIITSRGDGVLISEDGGITWNYRYNNEIIPGADQISEIQFINSTTGFASSEDGMSKTSIYKTSDAGITWQKVYAFSSGSIEYTFEFADTTHGIAFSTSNYYPSKLLITSDGGESWQPVDQSQEQICCNDLVYFDENLLYTGGAEGCMFKSVNAGYDWQKISHNLFRGPLANPVVFDENNAVMNQFNESMDTCYVIKTFDGFLTFDTLVTIPCKSVFPDFWVEMAFPDSNHGICIANRYNNMISYRTSNGGNTWIIDTITSYGELYDRLIFRNPSKGIFFTNFSMLITSDGGESWQQRFLPEHLELWDVCFPSESKIYMVGIYNSRNALLVSENDGDSWQVINDNVTGSGNQSQMYFRNEMTGYLMLHDGGIYKTTDGGINWTACTINEGTDWDFYDMTFTSADTGYVVGFSQQYNMLYTSNGGDTWQPLYTPTTFELKDVKFISKEKGFIFNRTEIYKTTTNGGLGIKLPSVTKQTFNAYPNPFRSALQIDISGPRITSPYQMSVFNTEGKLLYTTTIQPQAESILFQGSMLTPGVYFLSFWNEGRALGTVKVIKE